MPPHSHPFMIVQDMLKLRGEICKICKNFDKSHVCAHLALSSWQYIRISTNREHALPERAWSFRLDMEDHDKGLTSPKTEVPSRLERWGTPSCPEYWLYQRSRPVWADRLVPRVPSFLIVENTQGRVQPLYTTYPPLPPRPAIQGLGDLQKLMLTPPEAAL